MTRKLDEDQPDFYDWSEDVELQIKTQGVASYKVSDGEVFVFTTDFLEKLIDASKGSGKVIVFVKTRETV